MSPVGGLPEKRSRYLKTNGTETLSRMPEPQRAKKSDRLPDGNNDVRIARADL